MKKLRKLYIGLIMAFLYAPIVLLILYSDNLGGTGKSIGGLSGLFKAVSSKPELVDWNQFSRSNSRRSGRMMGSVTR